MRSRRGVYLGVNKHHSSTVHLILNPETGVISPQYHCIFNDTFSTVWSDGQFDHNLWTSLISAAENIDRHFSLEPNSEGQVNLPPDFVPFSPDITTDLPVRQQPHFFPDTTNVDNTLNEPSNNNNNNNNNNEIKQVAPNSPSSPILSRRMFTPSPAISTDVAPATASEPEIRRSTRSNLGNAPDCLDPSTHAITYHQEATKYGKSSDSIKNYCNVLGIKHPSTTRGRTISQGGCTKTSYTSEKCQR
jgi:hypothetical protein